MRLNALWLYVQDTGAVYYDRAYVTTGYSGRGQGVNNSDLQDRSNVGPIPRGLWSMGRIQQTPTVHSIRLNPGAETETARSGFLIHGGNRDAGRTASRGCIILPRHVRERMTRLRGWLLVARRSDEVCRGLWEPGEDRMVL